MRSKRQRGFTLLEVLIAVTIMAIISILTATNVKKSVAYKKKIDQDLDDYSAVRDALVIMTRDINLGFHWTDIDELIRKQIIADAQAQGKPPPPALLQQPQNNGAPVIPTEKLTGFIGDKESMYLTTLSHTRTIVNSKESDQAKVGYFLKDVKSTHDGSSTKGLIRAESPYLDGELDRNLKETVLLEHMKSLSFKYLGGDDKEWVESWKSESSDAVMGNKFPDAVEITLVTDHDGREISMSTVAAIHMPNNNPFAQPSPGTGP